MLKTILHIKERLLDFYPSTEVESFVAIIFSYTCNMSKTDMIVNRDRTVTPNETSEIENIVERLTKYEPIQYILGEAYFYGLLFKVDKSVLIPRGETEELVDMIINKNEITNPKIIDIGTGSGCIAIALKNNIKGAEVWACDISNSALKTAQTNANHNNVDIKFIQCDILAMEQVTDFPKFDIIVSNPPYIAQSERCSMPQNVLGYEPMTALFVPDNDPLLFYRNIGLFAKKHLKNGGKLYFEINEAFGEETVELLSSIGFQAPILYRDINGKNRMIECNND